MPAISTTWKKAQRFLPLTFRVEQPTRMIDLGPMVDLPDGYFPTNPSILAIDEGFLVCVRGVNYRLKDSRSMAAEFTAEGGFHTVNRFILVSRDFELIRRLPSLDAAFGDVEDIKLFAFGGGIYGIGSRVTERRHNSCVITLGSIDGAMADASFRDIASPFGLRQEKNWSPFSRNGVLYFLYSYEPLVILRYRFETGGVEFVQPDQATYRPETFPFLICGSSPGLAVADGHLFVAHRRSVRLPHFNRVYISRFYHLDWRLSAVKAGPYFVIERPTIQFVNGLAMDGDTVVISYGDNDHSAHVACFDKQAFLRGMEGHKVWPVTVGAESAAR